MQLTTEDRPYLVPGSPAGTCRLWLYRSPKDRAAVAVFTEIPGDAGPGLTASLGSAATAALRDHALSPGTTLWALRNVLADRREMFATAEFAFNGRALFDPLYEPTTRDALEILAGSKLPAVADDEVPTP